MAPKFLTAEEAAKLIKTGDTVATVGFLGNVFAEELAIALEKRFVETGEPKNLTFIYAAANGDGKERGLNHVSHEGLVKRVIGGHWNLQPKTQKLAIENKIEAYNLPQGTIAQLFREIAGKRPGVITHVGLKTFVDPRVEGGKLNEVTKEDIVEVINIGGKEKLYYHSMPLNVAMIRGTSADELGNISLEKEANTLEVLSAAQAVRTERRHSFANVRGTRRTPIRWARMAQPRAFCRPSPPTWPRVPFVHCQATTVPGFCLSRGSCMSP
jgi:propionate CoA-transferase